MFYDYRPKYSVQAAGARARVLVTTCTDDVDQTHALTTLEPVTATAVAVELNQLTERRGTFLHAAGRTAHGQPAHLRRALLGALTGDRRDDLSTPAHQLADLILGLSDAERRAITDEVGRIFDGADDVLVPVDLTDECGRLLFAVMGNAWLETGATDEDLLGALDGEAEALYEGLFAFLRAQDDDIEEACDHTWVDVWLNRKALSGWLAVHKPEVLARYAAEQFPEDD